MFDVPAVIVTTGGHGRRLQSPGRQYGDHHGIRIAKALQQFGFGVAQRGTVHRQSAGVFDGPAQRFDVGGITGQLLSAVVEHRDRGALGVRGVRSLQLAPGGGDHGRREAEAGHQHGVRQEGVQLTQIFHTAVGQVDVRLHRNARRQGGQAGQLGVGGLLAADQHRGDAAGEHRIDPALPGPVAAENPDHHDRSAVQQVGQSPASGRCPHFVGQPRRVGPPIVLSAGTGADQVRVGRRQQQDGRLRHPSFVPHAANSSGDGVRRRVCVQGGNRGKTPP